MKHYMERCKREICKVRLSPEAHPAAATLQRKVCPQEMAELLDSLEK